jgi:L-rhamnose mutarotase
LPGWISTLNEKAPIILTLANSKVMKRVAFKMKMTPGMKEEYIKRHDQIWPEIAELIKKSGVSDYSIFLDEETNILFGVQKVEGNLSSQDLGFNEIQKKWWDYMADIMETNPDNSPITIPLVEVFHLE